MHIYAYNVTIIKEKIINLGERHRRLEGRKGKVRMMEIHCSCVKLSKI